MTELKEMTEGKSLSELEIELNFQIKNGENLGGTIASHISHHINIQKNKGCGMCNIEFLVSIHPITLRDLDSGQHIKPI